MPQGCTDAIYGYLTAVYGLVAVWAAEGRETDQARRALCLQRLEASDREDPFAAVVRCTADPAKADKRTRSKWSRVMRYAAMYKPDSEPLSQFIRRKVASTNARLGSPGAWGAIRRCGDGQQEGDEAIISTNLSGALGKLCLVTSQVLMAARLRRSRLAAHQ
jgi:hypothetical protein